MLEITNKVLCGIIMPIALVLVGIYLNFKQKFFYILHPFKTFKSMLKGGFKSLSLALAGTLGVGNIVGVASAIISGGAGAVFWMWVSAFLVMSIKYAEVSLAMKYRQQTDNGEYYGGAPYYIKYGLCKRIGIKPAFVLGGIFALLCVCNSLSTGNLVQVNSVVSLIPIPKLAFGILFSLLTFIIIVGGRQLISSFTAILMPILSVFYVCISIYIIFTNSSEFPRVINLIFENAFSFRSIGGGVMGYSIMSAIRFGVSRGILSNEAGCGTSPTAHASSETKDIHSQGCLGIFEVFFDTILLCTLTAFVILIYGKYNSHSNAMLLVIDSFSSLAGSIGKYGIIASSLLFALATVSCQYYYGIESLKYISKKSSLKWIYTLIFCLIIVLGALIPMTLMWQISDLIIAIMTIFNLICILVIKEKPS